MMRNTNEPTFSVIIPTYNRAHLLRRAVNSVLAQTFTDYELLIVDDGSTDNTREVIQGIQDQRISYLYQKNRGVSSARNRAIHKARGEFISFLDDDDEYLPTFLQETRDAFTNAPANVGFMWSGIRRVREENGQLVVLTETLWNPIFDSREEAFLSFFSKRQFGTGYGFTVRASCFQEVGLFDNTMRASGDTDFFLRIARYHDYYVIPKILVQIYEHPEPKLHGPSLARGHALAKIIHKHASTLERHTHAFAKIHIRTAQVFYHAGNKERGRFHAMQAAKRKPFDRTLCHLILVNEILGPPQSSVRQKLATIRNRVASLMRS